MKRFIFTLCYLLTLVLYTNAKESIFLSRANQAKMNAWVDSAYNAMTPEERVGQLFAQVVNPKHQAAARKEIKRLVEIYHIGCIYFSAGTAKQHAELADYANSLSSVPLMTAIDGEWGLSMRIPSTPRFPKNMALGAIQNDRLLYEYGREMARECREMGININFAPSVDVNSNPRNPVIGIRSYGEDPANVTRKAISYARGLEDGGVLSVAKHFPGHGDTNSDSHKTLPTVDHSLAYLRMTDIAPFQSYINAGLGGIMVAHLNVPALGTKGSPTSLSERVVSKLLKNELGFKGLVFTDALAMKGARRSNKANGLPALLAGADVLLEPYPLPQSYRDILDYYKSGDKQASTIARAVKKILSFKYAMGLNNRKPITYEGMLSKINSRQAELVQRKLYAASMTILKNENDILPVKHLDRKICIVSIGAKATNNFSNTCSLYSDIERYSLSDGNADEVMNHIKTADHVIVGIFNTGLSTEMNLSRLILEIGADKVIPVFFIKPYDMANYSGSISLCNTTIVAYEDHPLAQEYAAQVVFGGSDATGRIPVAVDGVAKCGDGITLRASRLGYGMPEEVGIDLQFIAKADSLAELGIQKGAFPGCEVLVARHGKVVLNKSYGHTDKSRFHKITANTLYDLASVTKATGTLSAVMKAMDSGKMRLDAPLATYIPALNGSDKGKLTIRQLLFHETGMPAALNMYNLMTDPKSYSGSLISRTKSKNYKKYAGGAYINSTAHVRHDITSEARTDTFNYRIGKKLWVGCPTYDTIMAEIHHQSLRKKKNYLYSCLNFCLLKEAVENATKSQIDDYVYSSIFHKIGAYNMVYRPTDYFSLRQIAPTENDEYFREEVAHGVVHDETAAFSGGIQGNAGLFSNANDIAKLCQMWLNGGMYGGEQILSNKTVKLFTKSKSPNSHRGLGFDKPNTAHPNWSSTCSKANPEVYGHTGFTGTSFWVDPKADFIYVFLSNRVYPSRNNPAFQQVGARAGIMAELYHFLH